MVTEIEFLVELTSKGVQKVMSHPKFISKFGNVFKFKDDITDEEIVSIRSIMDVVRFAPQPTVIPDDAEHVLKESLRKRGLLGTPQAEKEYQEFKNGIH